ncbi:heptosyltransferase III [Anaerolineae bacterium]|nr:heptosyltransferase III [Anaerolineae bacterium]
MSRVLAVSLTALGDTLLSLPALKSLHEAFPESRIAFLVRPPFSRLYEESGVADEVIAMPTPSTKNLKGCVTLARMYQAIARFSPDTAVIFSGSPDYVVPLLRLAGAKRVVHVPNRHRFRFLLSNRALSPTSEWDVREHAVEDRLRAVRLLGVKAATEPLTLPVQEGWKSEALAWLSGKGWKGKQVIVFQLCSSNFRRAWPRERFSRLACDLFVESPDAICVLTGAPDEREYCEGVREMANDARVVVSAGELSLTGLAGLLSLADLVVTPDTGTMHLAHAVRAPTVSLYGLYDLHRTIPLDDVHPHIEIQRFPPNHPHSKPEDRDNAGMQFIPYEDVFNACMKILAIRSSRLPISELTA